MSTKYLGGLKESFANSVGVELCWGWSPAVDFVPLLDRRLPAATAAVTSPSASSPATAATAAASSKPSPSAATAGSGGKRVVIGFDEDGFPILGLEQPAAVAAASATSGGATATTNASTKGAAAASSAAADQQQQPQSPPQQQPHPINILLMGAADVRHIILTLSRMRRTALGRSNRPVHFYIFEPSLRVHCRHLLFLQLLLVDLVTLGELEDRVANVLDIFGNALLRDVSAGVLKSAAAAVSAALEMDGVGGGGGGGGGAGQDEDDAGGAAGDGDDEQAHADDVALDEAAAAAPAAAATAHSQSSSSSNAAKLAAWLDWTHMKTKEKDFVAAQILAWTRSRSHVEIADQWDARVRTELAERYDNRVNIFDWDFHFSLLDYSNLLRFPEYREFRKIGQAFDYCRINPRRGFRYEYAVPNKSLAQFNVRTGRGAYMGDVKNGPFFALGHDTENAHLKKREIDGTTIYGCGVIAMHTVRSWLYELVTGQVFPTDMQHKHAWEDDKFYNALPPNAPAPHVEFRPEVPPCAFHFVGLDIERFYARVARMSEQQRQVHGEADVETSAETTTSATAAAPAVAPFFDAAFVGATSTQWMTPTFFAAMRPHAVVVAETLKFVVDARDEAKTLFAEKIARDLAAPCGWVLDEALTERLHAHQNPPKPKAEGIELDASAKKAVVRSKMHHQVVLTREGVVAAK